MADPRYLAAQRAAKVAQEREEKELDWLTKIQLGRAAGAGTTASQYSRMLADIAAAKSDIEEKYKTQLDILAAEIKREEKARAEQKKAALIKGAFTILGAGVGLVAGDGSPAGAMIGSQIGAGVGGLVSGLVTDEAALAAQSSPELVTAFTSLSNQDFLEKYAQKFEIGINKQNEELRQQNERLQQQITELLNLLKLKELGGSPIGTGLGNP